MESLFSARIKKVPRSFIREILKVSLDPEIISFAGGIPNPALFPLKELEAATAKVFAEKGAAALQYSNSEGVLALREQVAARYLHTHGFQIPVENILITCGSQQALDLLGKSLLDEGDRVLIEEPGYLGAIQSLSLFQPQFVPVPLAGDGVDTRAMAARLAEGAAKMFYCVPTFQNPSGLSYTESVVREVADLARKNNFLIVEDSPYGELRFRGERAPSFYQFLPEQTVLMGTFSKSVTPGFRIGWVVAPPVLQEKLLIAKQAADLHTSNFTQMILAQYLEDNDLDKHIEKIVKLYGKNCLMMEQVLAECFPAEVHFTKPDGGMFLWGELPEGMESMALFDYCLAEKVVFVPGEPFYTNNNPTRSFRLSFSCVNEASIREGIGRFVRGYNAYAASL
ncbi:aminotransferase-like domain-containing protein [Desulfotalea psychrophila]|uniref:Related to multiple substrate aminotransferase n=1 Tax=Desulfotalea psychrophila (strain LSv54 / DSM 12343) TaxID=177439 RepID=Q6AMT6_DESPS|nr:PLP-dependent aminotransferase family protein [Desulfotalea psychrophila]CAG36339.1 related to multiple substrate aminotransferase [Desulfotalea psychrophila LSv54]